MALEEFRIQIAMLLDSISNQPEDMHELQETLREKLYEMRALGMPLPADLVGLEDYLEDTFEGEFEEDAPDGEEAGEGRSA
jgi:hypothetical protein